MANIQQNEWNKLESKYLWYISQFRHDFTSLEHYAKKQLKATALKKSESASKFSHQKTSANIPQRMTVRPREKPQTDFKLAPTVVVEDLDESEDSIEGGESRPGIKPFTKSLKKTIKNEGKNILKDASDDENSDLSLEEFVNNQNRIMNQKLYSTENDRFHDFKQELTDAKDVGVFLRQKGYPDKAEDWSVLDKEAIERVLNDFQFSIKVKILKAYHYELNPSLYFVEVLDSDVKDQQYEYVKVFPVGIRMLMCGELGVECNIYEDDMIVVYDPVYMEAEGDSMFLLTIFKNC